MNRKSCKFCTFDFDGYGLDMLTEGPGDIFLQEAQDSKSAMIIAAPHENYFSAEINYCPRCGRPLVDLPALTLAELQERENMPIWVSDLADEECGGWHLVVRDKHLGLIAKDGYGAFESEEIRGCYFPIDTNRGAYGVKWLAFDWPPISAQGKEIEK